MNLMTWNDPFKVGFENGVFKGVDFVMKQREKVLTSPLFIHDLGGELWKMEDHPYVRDEHNMLRYPFPMFRASLVDHKTIRAIDRANIMAANVIRKGKGLPELPIPEFVNFAIDILTIMDVKNQMTAAVWHAKPGFAAPSDWGELLFVSLGMGGSKISNVKMFYLPWRRFMKAGDLKDQEYVNYMAGLGDEFLSKFCIDWMNPHFFPASVQPKTQGKSVQWLEARTHYVLVHKSSQSHKGNTGKARSTKEEIQRQAVSRRAHWRYLRSERFRLKKGQWVHVKSCWVGPESWEGESGQIYKLCREMSDKRFQTPL